jgi:hypothetical protein
MYYFLPYSHFSIFPLPCLYLLGSLSHQKLIFMVLIFIVYKAQFVAMLPFFLRTLFAFTFLSFFQFTFVRFPFVFQLPAAFPLPFAFRFISAFELLFLFISSVSLLPPFSAFPLPFASQFPSSSKLLFFCPPPSVFQLLSVFQFPFAVPFLFAFQFIFVFSHFLSVFIFIFLSLFVVVFLVIYFPPLSLSVFQAPLLIYLLLREQIQLIYLN